VTGVQTCALPIQSTFRQWQGCRYNPSPDASDPIHRSQGLIESYASPSFLYDKLFIELHDDTRHKKDQPEFARYKDQDAELIGILNCGDCPGVNLQ